MDCNSENPDLTLNDLQRKVDDWISTIGGSYFSPLTNMACLAEEVGELARVISRTYGEQCFKPGEIPPGQSPQDRLADEMADALWVLTCLANQTGVNLTQAFERNLQKKTERDAQRFAHLRNKKA